MTNGLQHDAHVTGWLKAWFKLTVEENRDAYGRSERFIAHRGDWDLDVPSATAETVYGAALEYGMCHDERLFDTLVAIEIGEWES